jgi:hypothetical protein
LLGLSDARHFRRLVAGFCLIAVPVTLLIGALVHPTSNLRAAQARASLMTSSNEVEEAAGELGPNEKACGTVDEDQHTSGQQHFVEAAKAEITADE